MPSKLKSHRDNANEFMLRKPAKKPAVKQTAAEKAAEKAAQKRMIEVLMNLDLGAPVPPAKPKAVKPTGGNLLSAAQDGNSELACQLVEAGADVNAKMPNGWTPLQYAADKGDAKLAKLLLDKGAEVNHRNIPTGRAAVHYAAMKDGDEVLRLLIERGAELEIRNNEGDTPLLDAASSGKEACVKLLIDSGCDVAARNLAGKGVVYAAASAAHGDLAELLLTYPAESQARREALAAQQKAAGEALAEATTVLQDRVAVSKPLVFKAPGAKP